MGDTNDDLEGAEETRDVIFDPDRTRITFEDTTNLAAYDLKTLEDMGVITAEIEEQDGEQIVTSATLNVTYLGLMATEFNTTERSLGSRFVRSRYRPDIRLRY